MFDFLKDIILPPLPVSKNLYSEDFEMKNLDIITTKDGKYNKDEKKLLTEFSKDLKDRFDNVFEILTMERETFKKLINHYKIIYSCIDMMINNKLATDNSSMYIMNRNDFGCYKITKNTFNEIFEDKENDEYTLEEALENARNILMENAIKMLKVEADLIFVNRQLSILDINLKIYKNNLIKKVTEKKL